MGGEEKNRSDGIIEEEEIVKIDEVKRRIGNGGMEKKLKIGWEDGER